MSSLTHATIDTLFANQTTAVGRDLKLNLVKYLESGALSRTDAHLVLLAAATSVASRRLADYAVEQLQALGVGAEEIREARESAAIVAMLNTYYRFRHFLGSPEEYRIAGLRMTALARPLLGKERFEMLAFTVSVLNGCEACTKAHEKVLKEAGVSSDGIHDLARLAAIVNGLKVLLEQ